MAASDSHQPASNNPGRFTVLDENGVEIPFPHLTVYMGDNKDGTAPPIRVQPLDGETGQ